MKKLMPILFFIICSVNISFGQEVWENKRLGISVQKPEKWFTSENKKLIDILKRDYLTDGHLEKIADMFNGNSLLIFQKFNPKTETELNPTIRINIRPNEKNFQDFKNKLLIDVKEFKEAFDYFEFIEEVKEVEISEIKMLFTSFKYKRKAKDGNYLTTNARTYFVPYKRYMFRVMLSDGSFQEKDENCSKEFDSFMKTIRIGN